MENLEVSDPFWRERPTLVTGATGFVGSWLAKELHRKRARVVTLIRDLDPQSELVRSGLVNHLTVVSGRLEDFWNLERVVNEHEIRTVFHLGAQPLVGVAERSPLQTFEANIRGTYNLLEACRLHKDIVEQVVIASSDKAYGDHKDLPYVEDFPLKGIYPYEVSKTCADLISQAYANTYRLPIGIVRCGNIFGGGDLNWNRIVPGTIRSLLKNEHPQIRSDGSFRRDYLYVDDAVSAYIKVAEGIHMHGDDIAGQAFNFSLENPVTVMEVVQMITQLMHKESILPDIRNTAHGEIHSQYLSAAKARSVLKWKPAWGLERGMQATIRWYTDYLNSTSARLTGER